MISPRHAPVALLVALLAPGCAASAAPSDRASGPQTCEPFRARCAAALGWMECDDCDGADLANHGSADALLPCLAEALRCGPDTETRAMYARQDRLAPWSTRYRQRAAGGLASLPPEGPRVLRAAREWDLPEPARVAVERGLEASRSQ